MVAGKAAGTMTLGAAISHDLARRGVTDIFGIPGVHNVEMYRGIESAGLRHILARHEQGAGFMADGYARATGRPGVAYVITGPGLANVMTPMGQAHADSVPMLVLSSCLPEGPALPGRLHQMRDQRAAAETVAAASDAVAQPEDAGRLIAEAFAAFAGERPRPRHIQVPIDLLAGPAPDLPALAAPPPRPVLPDMAPVAALTRAARHPLLILGGGCRGAAAEAGRLAARMGAAVLTSYAGRGLIAPDSPLLLGAALSRPETARIIDRADLVIAIGTEIAEVDLWRPALGSRPGRVGQGAFVRIDIDPAVLADIHGAGITLQADAGQAMAALADLMADGGSESRWSAAEFAALRAGWRHAVDAERPGIAAVALALRAALPADAMIYSDMTQFAYVAKDVWDMALPGHWHHPTGFGTLGYALPAAIGGKVGRPGLPVVAIAGDYGFQYTMQELGTAAELGLPLPIVLWDNGKLKEIEQSMIASQIAPNAVVAVNPDFALLAAAYGAGYARPGRLEDLPAAVGTALARPGPSLLHLGPWLSSSS